MAVLLGGVLLTGCATRGGRGSSIGGESTPAADAIALSPSTSSAVASAANATLPNSAESLQLVRGKAINGYLDSAIVFVDINQDGKLSANEPVAVSRNGDFSLITPQASALVVVAADQLSAQERLIAEPKLADQGISLADVTRTTYVSDSGAVTQFSGRLESFAQAGSESINVTPLTTFASALKRSGLSESDSLKLVEQQFGVLPQLDYLASGNRYARDVSQSLSTFYQVAGSYFGEQGASREAVDLLSTKMLEMVGSLSQDSPMALLLSSPTDLKAIVSDTANALKMEINFSSLNQVLAQSFSVDFSQTGSLLRLAEDTGSSALDRVTSVPYLRFSDALLADAGLEFGISSRLSDQGAGSDWTNVVWSTEDPTRGLQEGLHRVYVRSENISPSPTFIEFEFDQTAPQGVVPADGVFAQALQTHFSDYVPGFIRELDFTEGFTQQQGQYRGNGEYLNYLVTTDPVRNIDQLATDTRWSKTLNLYESDGQERGFYLYLSLVDLAGNRSQISFYPYRLDRLDPLIPDLNSSRLGFDTGLYDWDRYTSNAELEAVSMSLRLGEAPNDHQVIYRLKDGESMLVALDQTLGLNYLPDGQHTLVFQQIDRADNLSEEIEWTFTLDRIAPVLQSGSVTWVNSAESGPLLTSLAFDSFTEWGQFGYQRSITSLAPSETPEVQWLDYGRPVQDGSYNIFYRLVDKAGNESITVDLGTHRLGDGRLELFESVEQEIAQRLADTDVFGSPLKDVLMDIAEEVDAQVVFSDSLSYNQGIQEGVSISRRGVSVSSEGLTSRAYSHSSYQDRVDRTPTALGDQSFLVTAPLGVATAFQVSAGFRLNALAVGSNQSDSLLGLQPGDIYLGLDGLDVASSDDDVVPLGLAFFSEDEILGIQNLVNGFLEPDRRQEALGKNPYMVYLNKPGTDIEGIAITDADLFTYGEGQHNFWTVAYNSNFSRHFFLHDAASNDFYYGGVGTAAMGMAGNDNLLGGAGSDFLVAGSSLAVGEDTLFGFGGDDNLLGGDFDTLSFSRYSIDGGSGDDQIYLGNGIGEVAGGSGSDTFHVAPIPGSKTALNLKILDFNPLEDSIVFHVPGLLNAVSSVFIDRETDEVIVNLSRLFLQSGFANDSTPLALDSLMTIQVSGLGEISDLMVTEKWFEFDPSFNPIWNNLVDGWVFV